MIGAENVLPPSFDTATTWRFGYFPFESAFSVQKTSTVPSEATVIWPVSRKPCAALLLAALTWTAGAHVPPSSSECAT